MLKIPNTRFNLKSTSNPKDERLIYVTFRYDGSKSPFKYSTGEKVPSKYWDKKSQKVKNVNASAKYIDINKRLSSLSDQIKNIYKDSNGNISRDDFREALNILRGKVRLAEPKQKDTFISFTERYIKQRQESPTGQRGTWKTWQNTLNIIKDYAKTIGHYNLKNDSYSLNFNHIDWDFRVDFVNYLYNTKNHSINYASKVIQVLTQFLNEANRREISDIKIHKVKGWHIKKTKVPKFRLTFDELNQLNKGNTDDPYTDRERLAVDLFLIGSYSGLRYSDFSRLKPENIIIDEGIKMIDIRTKKVDEDVVIPIFPVLESILDRYDYAPPYLHDQGLNIAIKVAATKAKIERTVIWHHTTGGIKQQDEFCIKDKISSHCARRSFASNFYELGIPAAHLMKITSHSTEKQFFTYICSDGKDNAKDLYRAVIKKELNHLRAV